MPTEKQRKLIHELADIGEKPESIAKELDLPVQVVIEVLNNEW